jgi:hypothetical protein
VIAEAARAFAASGDGERARPIAPAESIAFELLAERRAARGDRRAVLRAPRPAAINLLGTRFSGQNSPSQGPREAHG